MREWTEPAKTRIPPLGCGIKSLPQFPAHFVETKAKKFDLIELTHKMYHELIEAMRYKEGAYVTRYRAV